MAIRPNKIAITFDDGPDPEWTPKILDVLKQKQATATFFLIGIQADKFSGLAKRIYDEGHTIGNHTFTHPDVTQHVDAAHESGVEPDGAALRQPDRSTRHADASAVRD